MKSIQEWIRSHKTTSACFLLLIVILSLTVISFNNMFRSTMSALDIQSSHLNAVSTSQIRSEIDFIFSSAFELVSMVNTNEVVQKFTGYGKLTSSSEHYDLYELSRIISQYSYFVLSNQTLLDFAVYYPSSDVLINKSSYYRPTSYYDLWYNAKELTFDDWYMLLHTNSTGRFLPEASNSKVIVYMQSMNSSAPPSANTVLFFDRAAIIGMLSKLEQNNYRIAISLDGILLSSSLPESLETAILAGEAQSGDWNISVIKSNVIRNVSYYIMENPNSNAGPIPGLSLKRFYSIAIVLLVIIAFSAVGLTFFSIFAPITKKFKAASSSGNKTGSATPIKDAIDFVFSQNQDKPSDSEWMVVKDALLDLLIYSESTHDKTLDTLHRHNIVFSYPYFLIVLFTLSSSVPPDIFTTLSNKCNEQYSGRIVNACFPIGNGRFTSLFNLFDQKTPYMGAVELIKEGIQASSDAEVTVYIGSIQEGSTNIYRSYRDAINLSEYKIFTGSNSILDHNSFNLSNDEYYYPMDVELNLISAISRGDKEKVSSILKNIHEENFVNRQLSPYIAKLLLNELAGTTLKITRGMDSDSPENPAAAVLKCSTVEEVFYTLQQIYLNVCREHKSDIDFKKKDELKEYILLHYTDSAFSQSQMAYDLGVSQNYLSSQFKNYFGVNMNAYVNTLRVERAAEYLKETNYSVQDIAIMCGFSNGDALARVFKKKYSVTPTDYRGGVYDSSYAEQEGTNG